MQGQEEELETKNRQILNLRQKIRKCSEVIDQALNSMKEISKLIRMKFNKRTRSDSETNDQQN